MRPGRIAAAAAFVVGLLALARATSCDAGDELAILSLVTGVLAAVWADGPARSGGSRVALFLLVTCLVGVAVFFFTLVVHGSRCA